MREVTYYFSTAGSLMYQYIPYENFWYSFEKRSDISSLLLKF